MLQSADRISLATLRDAAERQLGRDHPCWMAIDKAFSDTAALPAAQAALHRLEPTQLDRLMGDVHKAMRENPALILAAWGDAWPKH